MMAGKDVGGGRWAALLAKSQIHHKSNVRAAGPCNSGISSV
jgi:hypothetical protein